VLGRSHIAGRWSDHLLNPTTFLLGQAASFGPIAVLALFVLRWRWDHRKRDELEHFQRRFVLVMTCVPVAIVMGYSAATGAQLRATWGAALWTFFPLALLVCLLPRSDQSAWRRAARIGMVATLTFAAALTIRNTCGPYVRQKASRVHFPGRPLASEVARRWQERFAQPVPIVAGYWWDVASVGFYLPQRTTLYATDRILAADGSERDYLVCPWLNEEDVRQRGAVVLWDQDEVGNDLPKFWRTKFPQAEVLTPIELPWQTGAKLPPVRLGMAVVRPQGNAIATKRTVEPSRR
jgi:hypothetical protein